MDNNIFSKIEKKTNIKKEDIIKFAKTLQGKNLKDEKVLKEIIQDISKLTGRSVSKEKEDKIIETIINDKIPPSISKM